MEPARFTLHVPATSLAQAEAHAEALECHIAIDALAVSIAEVDEARSLWETLAYFPSREAAEAADMALSISGIEIRSLEDRDWVKESLQGLAPVHAGRFFLHGSHDRAIRRNGGISLEIDAGTAFGTGHHNTTSGCLLALDEILKHSRPRNVLDLGCGTGVLAIAVARACHPQVLATDIDPESVRVTRLNARLNGISGQFECRTAAGLKNRDIADRAPYDLIFANILARPLVLLAQGLSEALAPGGTLILSGLTADQVRWVSAAYQNRGLRLHRRLILANWATLAFTRSGKNKRPDSHSAGRQVTKAMGPGWEEA